MMTTTRTSRVGRKPVLVPAGTEVKIDGSHLSVKTSKGQAALELHPYIIATIENNEIKVALNAEAQQNITGSGKKLYRSIAGTTRANIANLISGINQGFEKRLQLVGVGYRAQAKGKELALTLGFSHPTSVNVPEGISIETPTPTEIVIKGANKQMVGKIAAEICEIRPPEPYKGKGIRYAGQVIVLKETKKK